MSILKHLIEMGEFRRTTHISPYDAVEDLLDDFPQDWEEYKKTGKATSRFWDAVLDLAYDLGIEGPDYPNDDHIHAWLKPYLPYPRRYLGQKPPRMTP